MTTKKSPFVFYVVAVLAIGFAASPVSADTDTVLTPDFSKWEPAPYKLKTCIVTFPGANLDAGHTDYSSYNYGNTQYSLSSDVKFTTTEITDTRECSNRLTFSATGFSNKKTNQSNSVGDTSNLHSWCYYSLNSRTDVGLGISDDFWIRNYYRNSRYWGYDAAVSTMPSFTKSQSETKRANPSTAVNTYQLSKEANVDKRCFIPVNFKMALWPVGIGRVVDVTAPAVGVQMLAAIGADDDEVRKKASMLFVPISKAIDSLRNIRVFDRVEQRSKDISRIMSVVSAEDSSGLWSPRTVIHALDIWEYAKGQRREFGTRVSVGASANYLLYWEGHADTDVVVDRVVIDTVSDDFTMDWITSEKTPGSDNWKFVFDNSGPFTPMVSAVLAVRRPLAMSGQFDLDLSADAGTEIVLWEQSKSNLMGQIRLASGVYWYPNFRSQIGISGTASFKKRYSSEQSLSTEIWNIQVSPLVTFYVSPKLSVSLYGTGTLANEYDRHADSRTSRSRGLRGSFRITYQAR